jgi:hypothetical protein|tara:strand:+ start:532 stop:753 length:222 start_codon:yes stop_codon:yes gene_type:complete
MSRHVKVEGHPDLVRDKNSGAILNINSNAMTAARERKKLFNDRQQEIEDIKRDVTDIKNILMKLVEGKNGNND